MTERSALILSAVSALLIGSVALAAAVLSGSQAILLEALYNLAFFFTALYTLRVATLLKRPDDASFPFGYLYFEPLINTVKGLLILGVSLFALTDAVITIFGGGRALVLGPALVYAAVAVAACTTVWLVLRRINGVIASPLVAADIGNWAVNATISAGVLLAFVLALVFEWRGLETAGRFVDPVLVGLVVLISLGVPIRMAGEGLAALLNRAPPEAITAAIEKTVRTALADLPTRAIFVRTVKPGRSAYIIVHALVDPSLTSLDLTAADTLRRAVTEALVENHSPLIVDVVFTAIAEYAEPTTGFGPAVSPDSSEFS